jgi:hypothetical protein
VSLWLQEYSFTKDISSEDVNLLSKLPLDVDTDVDLVIDLGLTDQYEDIRKLTLMGKTTRTVVTSGLHAAEYSFHFISITKDEQDFFSKNSVRSWLILQRILA